MMSKTVPAAWYEGSTLGRLKKSLRLLVPFSSQTSLAPPLLRQRMSALPSPSKSPTPPTLLGRVDGRKIEAALEIADAVEQPYAGGSSAVVPQELSDAVPVKVVNAGELIGWVHSR